MSQMIRSSSIDIAAGDARGGPPGRLVRRGRRAGHRPHRRRCGIASAAGCQRIHYYLDKRPDPYLG